MTIEVKPRKQPARLEIELSTVWTGHQDQLDVVIRLTNLGPISFYVPTHITPLMGGNMLNSYHFEVRGPNDFVFTDPVHAFADGIFPKTTTEETLLQSGRIALVRPAETFSGKARFHVNGFSIRDETGRLVLVPGRYTARIRFDPQFPPGADKYKTKFLTEEVLSNEVVLNIN
jgi:hypothetical protein